MRNKMIFIIALIILTMAIIELIVLYIRKKKIYLLITIFYALIILLMKSPYWTISSMWRNIITAIAIVLLIPFYYSIKSIKE